jgi:thioredoxin 1
MLNRRHALATLAVSAVLLSGLPALALDKAAFSQASFDAAMKAGKPVLIDVSAPWCPTCKAQAPILSELAKQPRFKNLVVFNVDFDNQKDALRGFKAQQQSTLIVFKGGAEMGRSVGDTNKASIEALLARAI